MVSLTTYHAVDRRVYNGAFSSDMTKEAQHTSALTARMCKTEPTARCVYFPMEGKFMVFINSPPKEVTSNFHENKQACIIEAIKVLEARVLL